MSRRVASRRVARNEIKKYIGNTMHSESNILSGLETNKIIGVIVLAEILAVLSVFMEHEYPNALSLGNPHINYMHLAGLRFLHLLVVLFITFFFFFFQVNWIQGHLYLGGLLGTALLWRVYNMCLLNYYELRAYHVVYDEKIAVTLPFLTSLMGKYTVGFLVMNAIFPMITVNHIFNALGYSIYVKIVYYLTFFALSIRYLLLSLYHLLDLDETPFPGISSFLKRLVKKFIRV